MHAPGPFLPMRYGIWGLQEEQYIVSCLGMPPAEPFLLMRYGKLGLQEQYGMPSLFKGDHR